MFPRKISDIGLDTSEVEGIERESHPKIQEFFFVFFSLLFFGTVVEFMEWG